MTSAATVTQKSVNIYKSLLSASFNVWTMSDQSYLRSNIDKWMSHDIVIIRDTTKFHTAGTYI